MKQMKIRVYDYNDFLQNFHEYSDGLIAEVLTSLPDEARIVDVDKIIVKKDVIYSISYK